MDQLFIEYEIMRNKGLLGNDKIRKNFLRKKVEYNDLEKTIKLFEKQIKENKKKLNKNNTIF